MGVIIRWHAKAGGTYYISKDQAVVGNQVIVHSVAGPTSDNETRTLTAALDATSTTVPLNASLPTNTLVRVGNETIRLGSWNGSAHTNCERGYGGGIPQNHASGTTVYALQSSWEDTDAVFGEGRHVITYCVFREDSEGMSIPSETKAIALPTPPSDRYICAWGIVVYANGNPASGVAVTLELGDTDDYLSTGEYLLAQKLETQTGADGFFYFFLPRSALWLSGGGVQRLTLTVAPGSAIAFTRQITVVPSDLERNFLRLN